MKVGDSISTVDNQLAAASSSAPDSSATTTNSISLDDDSVNDDELKKAESIVGAKVRIKVPLKVYHVSKVPEYELTRNVGVVKPYVGVHKGKKISANLPYKVELMVDEVPLHCVYHHADCSIANNTSFAYSLANYEVPNANINFCFSYVASSSESNAVGPGNGPTASGASSSSFAATATNLFGPSWQSPKSPNLGFTFTSPSPSIGFAFGASHLPLKIQRYLHHLFLIRNQYLSSASSVPSFGQPTISPSPPGFMFGSTIQSQPSPFQFAGQQNQVASQNPSSFQASAGLEFNAGRSFSLGSGGGGK
ncbi:unnamed protein product [Fraxinus pennsylvanica]|uniref:Ferredoxin thioredoxin reductase alpha chain domain-containing protein n=1 Tax=Fraxinus pennsylvanica TaxID=56036 RepID=A0AAD2DVZ6_9LAMI|nr:unnamed protein product [Fraxinus pennsylvanica]